MGVIIGGATTVAFGANCCAVSAQWGMSANRQDVYCLGSYVPNSVYSILKPQTTLNLTVYSPGPSHSVPGSSSCENATTLTASVNPAGCKGTGGGGAGVSGEFWVVGYSYSKQSKDTPGQESWSLVRYEEANGVSPTVLRGTATGQGTSGSGITFGANPTSGTAGSISANSIGTSDDITAGIVTKVGAGEGSDADGGSGNASIPYNVLYI